MDRQDYLSSDESLPGDYGRYISGKKASAPDPSKELKYKLARLYDIDAFNRIASSVSNKPRSEVFQRFLELQQDPESLITSSMKLPDTLFGPMKGYI